MILEGEEPITLVADGLKLEGAIRVPREPMRVAVVLHPHPQFGGDMDNHVVRALCAALAADGAATLRFNFRGTGGSEGAHDRGAGETRDAASALEALRARCSGVPVVLAGYSFGAQVAASVAAAGDDVDALILVSPPLAYATLPQFPAGLRVLAVAGDADPVCPVNALEALPAGSAEVVEIPGAEHGWFEGTAKLEAAVRAFFN